HRVRPNSDEVGNAQQDRRRAGAPRAGQLRQLLRVRRGDRGEAAAGASLRGSLQGVRGGSGECRAASAPAGGEARHLVPVPRNVRPGDPNEGLRRWRSPTPSPPAKFPPKYRNTRIHPWATKTSNLKKWW